MEKSDKVIVLRPFSQVSVEKVVLDDDNSIGFKEISRLIDNGWIEHCEFSKTLHDAGIDMWVDDEGKLKELPVTLAICKGSRILEALAGNVVFTSFDGAGNTYGLSDKQIDIVKRELADSLHLMGMIKELRV